MAGKFSLRHSASLVRQTVHVVDFVGFVAAGVVAHSLRFDGNPQHSLSAYSGLMLSGGLLMVVMATLVYQSWRGGRLLAMLGRVALAWAVTWGFLMAWLVLSKTSTDFSRLWIITWALASLVAVWAGRLLVYWALWWLGKKGYSQQRVLLVGKGGPVAAVRRRLKGSAWTGFEVVGVVGNHSEKALDYTLANLDPDEVWICQAPGDVEGIQRVLYALRHSTANIRLVPDMGMFQLMNHGVTVVAGLPMLDIASSPMAGLNLVLKWLEDKVAATLILLLISPVMLGVALAVKLTSPGPVIFRQKRHGWNGETIDVFKFRSMYVHEDGPGTVTQARKGDARITPLGRVLRSTSLDELPQFFNVLLGTMSIVGPRPHAVAHNIQYRELIPRYMLRHKVKPGITGWAQINGFRGETDTLDKMEARIQADLFYIENWSIWLDLKIIFLTVFKGFVNENAY